MVQKTIFFLLLSLFLSSCESPHPNPELLDPIYSELLKEAKNVETQLSTAKKELEGFEIELKAVTPQTGKIKYAQKRVDETKARIGKLQQMVQYWGLRAESRLSWDREHYKKAFKEKKPWPPPEEYSQFKSQSSLENAPKGWSVKLRLEQARSGLKEKKNESKEGH